MKPMKLSSLALAWAGIFAAAGLCHAATPSPVESVRPMIGTDAHGHTYPGATVPFGMVQLSPDTRLETWDGCSGYHYSDKAILGFSHTHLSGTGCGDLGDIRVTPLVGEVKPPEHKDGYHLPFSHEREFARPGYYSVELDEPKVKVELTAAAHSGFQRYTFPAGQAAHLVFDLARGVSNQPEEGLFTVEKENIVSGYRRSKGWAQDKTYFFVAEFSQPFDGSAMDVDGKPVSGKEGKGKQVIGRVDFAKADKPVLVKIGLSAVSVEGARKNLAAEIPAWDFEAAKVAASQAWADVLGRIEVETVNAADRETFYTALYHACMAPTLFNDVDGSYRGLDGKPHAAEGFANYCTFSLWDTFRGEHPLLTIIQPQRVDDFINSMLAHYRQFNQHALPVWSLAGNETWCMIANNAIPVIAEACVKGFHGFDAEAAFAAMRDTSMQDRNLLGDYRVKGYVPSAPQAQSVSRTLEYAFNDWCVGRMAQKLGKIEDAKLFYNRSGNFHNVFDAKVGFMRGKKADGSWRDPFDPCAVVWDDYTEATAWNYSWFVPQDVPELVKLIGGDKAFVEKLDRMFEEESKVLSEIPDISGLIGQYVHGNEPCHHVAYLYCYAGAPWKTQQRIHQVAESLYNNGPDGLCGNDDCGQMSAWYVLSAMGFYSVNPASGVYVLGSPLVSKATIRLDAKYQAGREFSLVAEGFSKKNIYIQSATLNGKPLNGPWFTHAQLVAGGELVLKMGAEPNKAWGQGAEDRPPLLAPVK